jgi:hypothetical protein
MHLEHPASKAKYMQLRLLFEEIHARLPPNARFDIKLNERARRYPKMGITR